MTGTSELLETADQRLCEAIESLSKLGPDYPALIEQASGYLDKARAQGSRQADTACIGPQLLRLEKQAATLGRLLDAAVTLHLGRLAENARADVGYLPDGVSQDSDSGGCLRIDA